MCQESVQKKMTEVSENTAALDIRSSLCTDNEFFKQIIDLIPASTYFTSDVKTQLIEDRLQHNQDVDSVITTGKSSKKDAPQKQNQVKGKKRTGAELTDKAKLKRARFDPANQQTVSQIQDFLVNSEDVQSKIDKSKKKKKHDVDLTLRSTTDTMEELREKLRKKIDLLQAKRKALTTQDFIEKKRLRRQMSKLKHKMKKKTSKNNISKGDGDVNEPIIPNAKNSAGKPVYNKEGKMVFSKFDFSETSKPEKAPKAKDYRKLLKKVERDKEKMDILKKEESSAAKTAVEKSTWKRVLQKAEGVKLKDNPDLLKKSMKKKEKLKKKSKKEWQDRKDQVSERLQERQDKRKRNIDKKKKGRIDKKIKRAKKKGRIIPGF